MRIKAKNVTLSLQRIADEAAAELAEGIANVGDPAAPPYRLVPALGGMTGDVPAVLLASNARSGAFPGKAKQPTQAQAGILYRAPPALPPRRQSAAGQPENATARPPQEVQTATTSGRPVRKRKQPIYADDMIPSNVLTRRSSKPKLPAPQLPPPPQHSAPMLPMAAALAAAHAAHAAPGCAAAGMPAAIQLVTMPAPGGGTMTGLAIPPGALLAMPALLQQHLRAQGLFGPTAQLQPAAVMPLLGPPPYRLVPVVPPAPSNRPLLPAVKVAVPREIVALARQLDDEERKKALAASDARVMLRVVPGGQAATKGIKAPGAGQQASSRASGSSRGTGEASAVVRSRGRNGLRPRRPTPEPRLDLLPGTWHAGFEVFGGVTHVNVMQAVAAPPLPAVVSGTPPRFSQPLAHDPQEEFDLSDDPLRASLQFLRHLARTVGQQPAYSGAVQMAVNAERRLYKERLGRAHFARDGRRFAKERSGGTRKSVRMHVPPEVLMPPPPAVNQQQRGGSARSGKARQSPPGPEDATDVRRGAEFQAKLPAVRPRPAQPTAAEARWVTRLACQAGEVLPPPRDTRQAAAMPAASVEERAAWVSAAHKQLWGILGAERSAALGLLAMGADAQAGLLSDAEEAGLEAGMLEFGRAFHTIREELVPGRTVFELQNYYYNVWKLRATPRSRAWYEEKAAEQVARQAEVKRRECAAMAEQEAQRQRQEHRYKRRMLREVVQWVKAAARTPTEVQNRLVVVQRAQRAAKLLGSLNAVSTAD